MANLSKLFNWRVKQDVYILMRVYNDYKNPVFWNDLQNALNSILANRKILARHHSAVRHMCLMIYDDSEEGESYSAHKEKLDIILSDCAFNEDSWTLDYTHTNERVYSANSLFYLRKRVVELTANNEAEAVAIILDQDDMLQCDAILQILRKMPKGGVVLSPFDLNGPNSLNTVDVAQTLHTQLTRHLSYRGIGNSDPDIVCAATMCWTKAYSKEAMQMYVNALESFFKEERTGLIEFFNDHKAYDDFIDFYVLLRKDIQVSATRHHTHIYKKNVQSITSCPTVSDFLYDRTATLIAAIDLAYRDSACLIADWKSRLFRYISIKTMFIEDILSNYRDEFNSGNIQRTVFSEKTHNGYFINKFYRLAIGKKREESEEDDLFEKEKTSRGEKSAANFLDLFCCERINSIEEYRNKFTKIEYADSRYILQVAVDIERSILKPDNNKEDSEERLFAQYGIKDTPNMRRKNAMNRLWWYFGLTLPIAVGVYFLPKESWVYEKIRFFADAIMISNPNVKAALISLYGVILTYLLKSRNDIKVLASEEQSQMKLYFSEFEDLIRHLEANLKVMIQIVKRIEEENLVHPANIHMTNLAWPSTSFLFSDEFAKIINKERVDDFARVKVNLRNINNSAAWLSDFVNKESSPENIKEAIEWEIARHFGYLVNFRYLKENGFQFASQEELDIYINRNQVRNSLAALFMDFYSDEDSIRDNFSKRLDRVDRYIRMYYDDRRMKRNVLVYAINTSQSKRSTKK